MALAKRAPDLTVAEYLQYEKESPVKYEYVHGQIYAMAGTSTNHNRIARNICNRLDEHLADEVCEPFIADIKVKVSEALFYYPDVVVACDPPEADPYYRRHPILIVEVSSPTTERLDRHEKLPAYQRIQGLQEILLVAQDRVRVEIFRRQTGDLWQAEVLTDLEDELHLQAVGLTLSLAQIYRRVNFEQSAGS
jgi:Uma2 family endonuclease